MNVPAEAPPAVIVHFGLSKAASTFLQRAVFPRLRGLHFYKKSRFRQYPQVLARLAPERDAPVLFSSESFLRPQEPNHKVTDFAAAWPEAQPLLILRRQDQWLRSRYRYYLRKHGQLAFEAYFRLDGGGAVVRPDELEYRPRLRWLERCFRRPPLVYFQEEFQAQPEAALRDLAFRLGAAPPTAAELARMKQARIKGAYSPKQLHYIRRLNRRAQFEKLSPAWPQPLRWAHQKSHELLLHSTAALAPLLPAGEAEPLIPPQTLEAVRAAYAEDWAACLAFALQQRPLFLPTTSA
jgi:hypothetical protein